MKAPGISAAAVLAAFTCLAADAASAQDCSDPQTQIEMNECAHLDYLAADEMLNAEYKRARAALGESGATALRDAQRAWIVFRDKACEVEGAQFAGGSIRPMVVAGCLARLTRRRTEDLRLLSQTY
ncbi:MAG TPA: lysozyme inhibitor LprI family protein [Paracoccaceae bacterium]|nr:lysozyme inhibitor LprI family protein [Paracoccaceae bacterium]